MALSGQIVGASYNNYRIIIDWSASQDIANNFSDVTGWLYLQKVGANSSTYNTSGSATYAFNIGGQVASSNTSFDMRSAAVGAVTLISAFTTRAYHNSDGTGACYFEAWLNTQGYTGTLTIGGTYATLDTIPRASTITGVTSSVAVGSAVTINVDKKSAGFTHIYRIGLNGIGWYYTGSATSSASLTYTIPKTWANYLPNNTSYTGVVGVRTYSGSTQIGAEQYAHFTVTIPGTTEFKPSMSVATTRINGNVPSAWGIYIQGQSGLKVDLSNLAGAYGSTIQSKVITIDNTSSSNVNTFTRTLNSSGTVYWLAKLTDSRGRSMTYAGSVSVVEYSAPKITSSLAQRCLSDGTLNDEGSYLKITASGSFSSCNGNNSATMQVSYKKTTDTTYSTPVSITSGVSSIINAGFGTDYAYDVKVEITDTFSTGSYIDFVSTTLYALHFKRGGNGIAFGKAADREGYAEFAFDVNFENGVEIDNVSLNQYLLNRLYPVGSIYLSVLNTSPATLFGGTWVQLQNRFLLGAGSSYSNGATGGASTHTLTVSQIPAHGHTIDLRIAANAAAGSSGYGLDSTSAIKDSSVATTRNTGSGGSHNNMPPYLVVYMWKRTA